MSEKTATVALQLIGEFDDTNVNATPALQILREAVNDLVNAGYVVQCGTLTAGSPVDLTINPA